MMKSLASAVLALGLLGGTAIASKPGIASSPHPVVMISIDGLGAEDLNHAQERGLPVDHLLAVARAGVRAEAVRNVAPTLTYPNHTTLITGVTPAQHMVLSNQRFDPEGVLLNACYWFTDDIHAPTLWDAVHNAGGKVANVYWPVAVGARAIDINFPEYWAGGQPKNWSLIAALSATRMLPGADEAARRAVLKTLIEPTMAGDQARANLALDLFAKERPRLTTLHLVSLDETQHREGPDTDAARAALGGIDAMIGKLIEQVHAIDPETRIVIVSDHGQAPVERQINLGILLTKAGLETLNPSSGHAARWQAAMWNGGGSAYLVLHDPAARDAAMTALKDYANTPGSAIEKIVPMTQPIADRPDARIAAMIFFQPGFEGGNALNGALITPSKEHGQHGGSPDNPALRSIFIAAGPGVPKGRTLDVVDMRAIAPTIAKMLNAPMPSATEHPLF
ncbi:MAG: alkaline phosphatase family protein [Sphingobium sp.]|nr:alkaline phosphatase family protein [Sphingobium sp.]